MEEEDMKEEANRLMLETPPATPPQPTELPSEYYQDVANDGDDFGDMPPSSPRKSNDDKCATFTIFKNEEEEEEGEVRSQEGWSTFKITIHNAAQKLASGEKYTSHVFSTRGDGHLWRLGVHFGGYGSAQNLAYISCFLEMGEEEQQQQRGSLPGRFFNMHAEVPPRSARFKIDICDLHGGMISSTSKTPLHCCGAEGDGAFNLDTARDRGFTSFYKQELFRKNCIRGDGTAEFIVHIKPSTGPPKQQQPRQQMLPAKAAPVTNIAGLENQGATCYLNSLIQTLFHIPALRAHVYAIDTASDVSGEGVVLEMQRLFADLQLHCNTSASTERLTRAFGWTDSMVFIQHDVQEMLRELLDKLEQRILQGNKENKIIAQLFSAQYESFVRCASGFTSSRREDFFDLSLDVHGFASVEESFEMYCKEEELTGDNQYEAPKEHGGKQDAIKGVRFISLPPVLHLHLKRFAYNFDLDKPYKIHDRFAFSEELDLNRFVAAAPGGDGQEKAVDHTYRLHSVLVHSGNDQRGHYYVYIFIQGKWYKFNDEMVTAVSRHEAVDEAFGDSVGTDTGVGGFKRWRTDSSASAYMLVYIRKSMWDELMRPVEQVPSKLLERFAKLAEVEAEEERRKHSLKIKVATLEDFIALDTYSAVRRRDGSSQVEVMTDFVDWSRVEELDIGDVRACTNDALYKLVQNWFNSRDQAQRKELDEFRLWLVKIDNHTTRAREEVSNTSRLMVKNWLLPSAKLFIELDPPARIEYPLHARGAGAGGGAELALFFRKYDPETRRISRGSFISNTGLFHTRSTFKDLYEVFYSRVLTEQERNQAGARYVLFDLFDLVPSKNGELDNLNKLERDDSIIDDETLSLAGDILIYSPPHNAMADDSLETYMSNIVFACDVTAREINSNRSWTFQSRMDYSLEASVCAPLAKLLALDEERIAIINMNSGGEPYTETEHRSKRLLPLVSSKRHHAVVYVEVLPMTREQLFEYCSIHFVVHVPRADGGGESTGNVLFRNDCATPVTLHLLHEQVSFETLESETRAFLNRTNNSSGEGEEEFVLLAVTAYKPEIVRTEKDFATLLSSMSLSWHVFDAAGKQGDGGVVVLPASRFETRCFGEFIKREPGAVALMRVMHCSSLSAAANEDVVTACALPTVCALVEGDTLGSFWKRLLAKLYLHGKQLGWRPLFLLQARAVFLDQDTPPPPPSHEVVVAAGATQNDENAPLLPSSTLRRGTPQPPSHGESSFDSLPLWNHAGLADFVRTRDVNALPILYLLHPPSSTAKSSSNSQVSLSIRST